jgi:hypothetical protein
VAPAGQHFIIDGSDTIIFNDHGVTFSAAQPGETIALSRVTINASEGTAVSASNSAAVLLYGVTLGASAVATGGSLSVLNSSIQDVQCSSAGILDIEHSTTGRIFSDSCGVDPARESAQRRDRRDRRQGHCREQLDHQPERAAGRRADSKLGLWKSLRFQHPGELLRH